jgi:hypothetical protein
MGSVRLGPKVIPLSGSHCIIVVLLKWNYYSFRHFKKLKQLIHLKHLKHFETFAASVFWRSISLSLRFLRKNVVFSKILTFSVAEWNDKWMNNNEAVQHFFYKLAKARLFILNFCFQKNEFHHIVHL